MNSDIPGKYINEKSASQYLELKPDGSCFLFAGSAGYSGTYEIEGGQITIVSAGSTSRGNLQDGVITDEEGDRWVRASSEQRATNSPRCPKCGTIMLENAKFCSSCGTVLNTSAKTAAADRTLDSISWLPDALKKDLPWELYEAIGWAVVLMLVLIS